MSDISKIKLPGDTEARNVKDSRISTQTAYTSKGSATKVPQITTNTLGQVTKIEEVTITNTKNTAGTTNKTGAKMYIVGATSQAANPQTYSNSNVYIGTDNCLYSNGNKVLTSDNNDNQTIKTSNVTFGANDAVELVGGTNVTVVGDSSAKTITINASQPDVSNFIEKSSTSGLVKNDGTIDTNTYLTTSGTAANSTKLNNQNASYYLNYNNLSNKPSIPSKDSDLTNDRYVRYDTNAQGLTNTQKSNARTNIGAGTSNFSGSYNDLTDKPTIPTDTGATSIETSGSGNAVTTASYSANTRKITLTKGSTFLTSHQNIKTLDTTATTAQSTSSSEAIKGSGTITLHKIAKTGSYNDLSDSPDIPTDTSDLTNGAGFITSSDIPVTDVKIGSTSIVNNKVATLQTNGTYNASTNKIATMSDIPDMTNVVYTNASVQSIDGHLNTNSLNTEGLEIDGTSVTSETWTFTVENSGVTSTVQKTILLFDI